MGSSAAERQIGRLHLPARTGEGYHATSAEHDIAFAPIDNIGRCDFSLGQLNRGLTSQS